MVGSGRGMVAQLRTARHSVAPTHGHRKRPEDQLRNLRTATRVGEAEYLDLFHPFPDGDVRARGYALAHRKSSRRRTAGFLRALPVCAGKPLEYEPGRRCSETAIPNRDARVL